MSDHNGIHWTEDDGLLGEYILGRVPDEEKRRLDAHLEICRQCRQAVQTEKEMAAGIRLYGRGQVASRLQQRLKNRSERNRRIVTWQRILSAAAVLVIVAGIGIYKQWFSWGERKDLLTREDFQESKKEPVITEGGSGESGVKESNAPAGKVEARPSSATRPRGETTAQDISKDHTEKSTGLLGASEDGKKIQRQDHLDVSPSAAGGISQPKDGEVARPETIAHGAEPVQYWTVGGYLQSEIDEVKSLQKMEKEQGGQQKAFRQENSGLMPARRLSTAKTVQSARIELGQRSFNDLPLERQQVQWAKPHSVQASIQQSEGRMVVTMYLDTLVDEQSLQNATVEAIGSDSILVAIHSRLIGFRLPVELVPGEQGTEKLKSK